jgi:putative transposase
MSAITETLGVARSNLIERRTRSTKSRGRYRKAEDADLLPLIRAIVDERPTYGYRRVAPWRTANCAPTANRRSI